MKHLAQLIVNNDSQCHFHEVVELVAQPLGSKCTLIFAMLDQHWSALPILTKVGSTS
jgi:hypothetical protein